MGRPVTEEAAIFEFEKDFAGSLRCIPMIVRFKLDQCGIKLTLRQWAKFTREERGRLVDARCDTPGEVKSYGEYLAGLIELRAKDPVRLVEVDSAPVWNDAASVPTRLLDWAANLGVRPPSVEQWARLTPLQRFALFKLTRPAHDNDNFIPAMREFGLTP